MSEKSSEYQAYRNSVLYDYPTEPVPQTKRKSIFNLSMVTAGLAVAMSTLYTGASLAHMLSYQDAIKAILVGCVFLAIMAGIMGGIGSEKGVTFSVLARHAFGRDGSKIVGLMWAISLTGWFAYQCGFFGQTINLIWPNSVLTQVNVAAFWGGILMMTTAIIGYRGLSVLSIIASPVILALCVWGSILALGGSGVEAIAQLQPSEPATLGTGITVVIGGWIVGSIMQPDVSRYGQNKKHNWVAVIIAMIVFAIANFGGMVMVKATAAESIMAAMVGLGMGIGTLFMVILAQWTSNDNNLYSASLGIANIKSIPKYKISIVLGIIATIIGTIGVQDYFVPFLCFLGTFIPPIGGVILIDYYFLGKKDTYTFDHTTRYRQWNMAAIVAVILAGLVSMLVHFGVDAINSFILGGLFYWIFMTLAKSLNKDTYVGNTIEHEVYENRAG